MDSFFEFLGYVAERFVALCKRIHRSIMNTFFLRRIAPRPSDSDPRLPRRSASPLRPIDSDSSSPRRSASPSRKKFQILD